MGSTTRALINLPAQILRAALFLAVLVGLPLALTTIVGWPGPTAVPQFENIEAVLTGRQSVPSLFLIKAIAVFGWIIWLQLALAVVEELRAARLDLVARKTFILPGIQKFVASAVLAITLLINGLKPASAVVVQEPASVTQPHETQTTDTAAPDDAPTTKTYTTKVGDSWWSVATSLLGDGSRFDELRQLNTGKTFNGIAFETESDYLGVGWDLEVPADAVFEDPATNDPEIVSPASDESTAATVTVAKDDTISELEQRHDLGYGDLAEANNLDNPDHIEVGQQLQLPPTAGSSEIVEPAEPPSSPQPEPQPSTPKPTNPPALKEAEPSPAPREAPSTPPPSTTSPVQNASPKDDEVGQIGARAASRTQPAGDHQEQTPRLYASSADSSEVAEGNVRQLVGTGLVSLAIMAPAFLAVRRRRYRSKLRTVTTEPVTFTPLDEEQGAALEVAASYGDLEYLKVVLQLIGQRIGSTRTDPGVLAVLVSEAGAEIRFQSQPNFNPGPHIRSTTDGWVAERPASLDGLKSRTSLSIVPYPAMVTLGSKDDTLVTINLEQLGGLNLIGDQAAVDDLMAMFVVELAASPLAETLRVLAVGFETDLPNLDRIEQHSVVPPNLAVGERSETMALQRLLTVDPSSNEPIIVVSRLELPPELLHSNIIPIVANSDHKTLTQVEVTDTQASFPALRLSGIKRPTITNGVAAEVMEPRTTPSTIVELTDDGATAVVELVDERPANSDIDRRTVVSGSVVSWLDAVPTTSNTIKLTAGERRRPAPQPYEGQPAQPESNETTIAQQAFSVEPEELGYSFVVSVLGRVRLNGVGLADPKKPWKYNKSAELVTLLATSERPRTGDELKSILWPGRDPKKASSSLANAVSDARHAIVGQERLPKLSPGQTLYKTHGVGTDLDVFDANLAKAGEASNVVEAMAYRAAALALVEGTPFDTFDSVTAAYGWSDALRIKATIDIVNAAVILGCWQSERRDFVGAAATAERGLKAAPENYALANLYGQASLASSDDQQIGRAFLTILEIANQHSLGEPGLGEQELPEYLQDIQNRLEERMKTRTG